MITEALEQLRKTSEIAYNIKRKYEEDKLLFYRPCCVPHDNKCPVYPCPDSKHTKFHFSNKRIKIIFGGNRCIDGETFIEDPVRGNICKVKDIKSDFYVWAWNGTEMVAAKAKKPFIKGIDDLYEVLLEDGSRIVATENHRILTRDGYVSVSNLSSSTFVLTPKQVSSYHPETILEHGQLVHVGGGRSSLRRVPGSRFDYRSLSHLYDGRPQFVSINDQAFSPLSSDVPECTGLSVVPSDEYEDDQGHRRGYSRSCLRSDRPSSRGDRGQIGGRFVGILSRAFYRLCKSISEIRGVVLQSMLEFFLPQSIPVSDLRANLFSSEFSYSAVTGINKIKRDVYYDFEVPGFNNYFAGGMVHHNSGKSVLGLTELLMMACFKIHPYRKTENRSPGKYRIYGSDFGIIEKLIIPLVKAWIPKDSLKGSGKNKEEAWENSWDNKYHILYLKNGTVIDFMSYDQDSSKSESVELDGIWADEQMPENVYSAALARLISRKGFFWMTVTPLYDISWAMKFLDTPDPSVDVFSFDITENPHLSKEAIKEFEASVPEHEKEARLHGRFLELQGLVYKELRPDIHLIDHEDPKTSYPIIFALDPHPRKASVMVWAYVAPKGDVVFFDELEMRGSARDIVSAIREKESKHPSQTYLRLIDPAAKAQGADLISYGTDTLKEFEKEGMNFSLADNSDAGYNIVHEYLTWNPKFAIGPLNRPQCFFTKNVTKTWYGMTHLLWDEWNFKKSMRDEKERIRDYKKDFPDCVRYVLARRPTARSFSNMAPVRMNRSVPGGLVETPNLIKEALSNLRRKDELNGRSVKAA